MNRRDFLHVVALGAIAARFGNISNIMADTTVPLDPTIVAIFSDTHIHGPETTRQASRFKQGVAKVLAMNPRPANLLIYGDVAYLEGKVEEYKLLRELIKPIEDAGIHWEITLGNHDRIANYREIFPERFEKPQPIEGCYINIVETPNADFILLDSYLEGKIAGAIEPEQREWLVETLKNYEDKPVFVGCHHPLNQTLLADTLKACPKCVAYLFGHHHYYRSSVQDGVKTLCLPSLGHWGDLGFVTAHISENEAVFAPDIDDYLWSNSGYVKEPEKDVEAYLAALNANSPVFQLN
ncbi:MAG: metallophosphoesterase family protein [Thermoguttaceae bacterium]|jgi:Icc protein